MYLVNQTRFIIVIRATMTAGRTTVTRHHHHLSNSTPAGRNLLHRPTIVGIGAIEVSKVLSMKLKI